MTGIVHIKKIFREKPSLQNIDELHTTAGTKNLLELHGSLFRVRCIDCGEVILEGTGLPIKITPFLLRSFRALKVTENKDSPICKALEGRGAPDPDAQAARIPEKVFQRKYSSFLEVFKLYMTRIFHDVKSQLVEAFSGRMWSGLVKI